jgi:hypothetical protein
MAGVAADLSARIVVGVAAAIAIAIISYGLLAAHVITMAVCFQRPPHTTARNASCRISL